jgi:hypothetical protein
LSPLDPAQPFPTDPIGAQVDKNADFARRLAVLERGGGRPPALGTHRYPQLADPVPGLREK